MKRGLLAVLLLECSCLQGCFYATRNVQRIGLRHEWIEHPTGQIIGENGAVALACDRVEWREPYGRHGGFRRRDLNRIVINERQGIIYCLQARAVDEISSTRIFALPWQTMDEPFAHNDPSRSDLPKEFGNDRFQPFDFDPADKQWLVHAPLTKHSRHTVGGKCAQALLPFAFIFDLATGPIQFFLMLNIDPPPL